MNPNMFGGMPMQLPKVPTPSELWENEKEKYRHWIILFGLAIIAIAALFLTSLILTVVRENEIKDDLFKWGNGKLHFTDVDPKKDPTKYADELHKWADSYWRNQLIVFTSIKFGFAIIGVVLYIQTVIQAYQRKSFSKLSSWASFVIGICALFGVFQLFYMAFSEANRVVFSYPEGIYDFILYILPIVAWFFISRPIAKIKRTFMYSERIEMIKKSPQYQQMQQQMESMQNGQMNVGGMGPFGPTMPTQQTNVVNPEEGNKVKELTKKEKRYNELRTMTVDQLREVAKKMSISGYSTMKKSELIEAINRLSNDN